MAFKMSSGWAGVILTIICMVSSIGGTFAVFSWRLDYMQAQIKRLETATEIHNDIIIRNDEKLENIYETLIRIEGKIDDSVTEEVCQERCARILDRIE